MKTNRILFLVGMAGIFGLPNQIAGMDGGSKTKVSMNYSPGSSPEPEPERSRKNSKSSSNRSSPIPLKELRVLEKQQVFPAWIETDGQRLLWALADNMDIAPLYITDDTANSSDEHGFYALHYAVLVDNYAAAKALMACGAVPQVRDKNTKKTPYMLAFEHRREETFKFLKKYATPADDEEIQHICSTFIIEHKE